VEVDPHLMSITANANANHPVDELWKNG